MLSLFSIRGGILPFSFSVSVLDHPYFLLIWRFRFPSNTGTRCSVRGVGKVAVTQAYNCTKNKHFANKFQNRTYCSEWKYKHLAFRYSLYSLNCISILRLQEDNEIQLLKLLNCLLALQVWHFFVWVVVVFFVFFLI